MERRSQLNELKAEHRILEKIKKAARLEGHTAVTLSESLQLLGIDTTPRLLYKTLNGKRTMSFLELAALSRLLNLDASLLLADGHRAAVPDL